ncbi:radical SAM family heme chaperone HemW [Alkalicoccus chagannorensis]|uniref:radical SAM family heme chaperone HemW n=1 Tax=Alkalicoccus chagannorensis TaxID=427072 RepID=UPI000478F3BC|nr:radical SAM family heme chaperone HemW [Alkalicoccus chagannorensis]
MARALYVHVPFCEQICHYCDFNKFFLKNQPVDQYVDTAVEEMEMTTKRMPTEQIDTIYVGGGTPTALTTPQLERLLRGITTHFPVAPDAEWTVEVNPGSADIDKMKMMKQAGVNRLSIGVQTFDEGLLQAINRDHQNAHVEETLHAAHTAGITNLSIDLMFGLPTQTFRQWQQTLQAAVSLPVTHISAYSLKIEPKTVFYQMMNRGHLRMPAQEVEADMYEELLQTAEANDFLPYEISNFAKPGFESRHNLTYWNNEGYYGIGAGAHSYTEGIRRRNHGPLPKYFRSMEEHGHPYLEEHPVTFQEKMEEEMFMGLRKRIGVSGTQFHERYGMRLDEAFPSVVPELVEHGLLERNEERLALTEKGRLLGNEVFERFLIDQ